MEAGASGYILKDDQATIQDLGNIVLSVAKGGIYFSQKGFFKHNSSKNEELLTARQLQALSLCVAYPECLTEELAHRMGVSNSTVRNLLSGAYLRLSVHNRAAAIAKARELGIITPHEPQHLRE